jgi:hypothetical protein
MNCLDVRRAVGAEPALRDAGIEEHLRACPACTEFAHQLQVLDRRLVEALAVAVPARPRRAPALSQAFAPPRRWALAASVLLAVGVAFAVWLAFPRSSLAADLVSHATHEPESWSSEGRVVSAEELAQVLRGAGLPVDADLGRVTYARSCWFRGHLVPHLVVQDESGPITLLLLSEERIGRETRFSEGGYSGVILPAAHGSVAVLAQVDTRLDTVATRAVRALD